LVSSLEIVNPRLLLIILLFISTNDSPSSAIRKKVKTKPIEGEPSIGLIIFYPITNNAYLETDNML